MVNVHTLCTIMPFFLGFCNGLLIGLPQVPLNLAGKGIGSLR